MSKILLLLSIIFLGSAFADGVNWVRSFPEATSQAIKSQKPIFFVLNSHKNDLVKEIEKEKEIVAFLNKKYISLLTYKEDGGYLPRTLVQPTAPSMWFLTPGGKLMYQQQAYNGHVDMELLPKALVMVDADLKQAIVQMKQAKKPYTLDVKFKYYTDLEEAKKASKASKKPIFMLVGRNSCKYCVKLKKDVLVDKQILADLEKNFVVMVHDANRPLDYQYSTPGIPAIWFLDENAQALSRPLVGFVPKQKLSGAMKYIQTELKKIK